MRANWSAKRGETMYCDVSSTRRVAVYCASSFGHHPLYADVAAEFGRILAERNIGLVYGGSGTGTMQSLAEAVLGNGGEAIGVYPAEFPREQLQPGLTRTIEVESLAERKEVMLELADAVVALPGRLRYARRTLRCLQPVQARLHPQAVRTSERGRLLRFSAGIPRSRGRFRSDCETGPGDAALLRRSRRAARRA